ncbi:MAG TPA: glyoxalase [Porticoccaceae bacterium]|nr:glyoxalase [Porticoccaceae bacterium]
MHPQIKSINAITLVTQDMAASFAFYRALGLTLKFGGEDSVFTSLSAGECHVNLVQQHCETRHGFWGRVIFYVDDVDSLYQQIVSAGYRAETEPADASWGERYFHIRDPDDHELSFACPLNE